jgi:hypothetical protein
MISHSNLDQDLVDLIAKYGDEVQMGSIKCGLWKETHPGCNGCPYALGCLKYSLISNRQVSNPKAVLQAKSVEEIKELLGFGDAPL